MLNAYRLHLRVPSDRRIVLENVPFDPGTDVEIIVLANRYAAGDTSRYSLRGAPITYVDPTGALEKPEDEEEHTTKERVPGSAKGLFVVPDDFDTPSHIE